MTLHYQAPLQDIEFVLYELLGGAKLNQLPRFTEVTPNLVMAIISEGGKLCEQELFPCYAEGDRVGCLYDPSDQSVKTPPGFRQAYQRYVTAGWNGVTLDEAYGGQALPHLVGFVMEELSCATNLAFSAYPGLTGGAINCISAHASETLKQQYLPPMAEGKWSGTMCLTEPQCGTDLGLIKTKAIPFNNNDQFRITGTKIWITSGEHDLTDNIIHLVLAKLPDAPEGTKGISLFLVPKLLPDGSRNGVSCGGVEHKMGLNGSATCVMNFEDAVGWLVGPPNGGLRCMFTMMNNARLMVGLQGLGLAETAYQTALTFAKERLQSRAVTGAKFPELPADPIIVHPDVRRMLLRQKVINEGNRALAYWVGAEIDISEYHPDKAERQQADDFIQLMTPVVKAFLTDEGSYCCNLALQTLGGAGYTKDWGIEQLVRDVRITRIYEGTNGIQALDLVSRKLPLHQGRLFAVLLTKINLLIKPYTDSPHLTQQQQAINLLKETTQWLAINGSKDPEQAVAVATPYLRLVALVCLGALWLKMAALADQQLQQDASQKNFYQAKIKSAHFFFSKILPEIEFLSTDIQSGKTSLMDFELDEF
ncbi:acyl-CoA dehydrogenase C-terminal domain-containing protein [Spartinivicinus marinus]|uniref:acyl-CoA dehydrogenase C-terminal domain-containing protein n=1 Tax=Spartinivicinus marinus TaxID=2994442 RepID=UPI0021062B4B|nr:acyl-CoA dehydrogenase C-terminal domain-containing protein [Spartinivicinus marinus]MCX4025014.1 acyl-CoA dehydrogenase C-terminal domain-containing protein [Spartinivicinus marinus]